RWRAAPVLAGAADSARPEDALPVRDPADRRRVVGTVRYATAAEAARALDAAHAYQPEWDALPAADRAALLKRAANALEADAPELIARSVAETEKTIPDSANEVREAAALLRYYAAQCERLFTLPLELPGPTGERNELKLRGRGVFMCVSPWNFPAA